MRIQGTLASHELVLEVETRETRTSQSSFMHLERTECPLHSLYYPSKIYFSLKFSGLGTSTIKEFCSEHTYVPNETTRMQPNEDLREEVLNMSQLFSH